MTAADRLNEIQARAEKATHGPWEVQEEEWAVISSGSDSVLHAFAVEKDCIECGTPQDECDTEVVLDIEDVEFIAHARSDVPALVAALRAVLELHKPVDFMDGEVICAGCDGGQLDPPLHPCQTYRVIASELGKTP